MALTDLPKDLPVPEDDGAAEHLLGTNIVKLQLPSTLGKLEPLSMHDSYTVLYIYPMTGRPGLALPDNWEAIPGARGCTPQSCSFRDHYIDLQKWQLRLFGLSTQTTIYQQEAKTRLHLPFDLLSDEKLELKKHMNLPTFSVDGMELYKRLTLILKGQLIVKVFYPVFPPDQNASDVLEWFQRNA